MKSPESPILRPRTNFAVWTAVSVLPIVFLAGCGGQASIAGQQSKERPQPRNPLEITADDNLMLQLTIGEPQWANVTGTLRVAGRVEADETRVVRVSAPVTGRIVDLELVEGQIVKRGQVIATIHSTDLSTAQSAFLTALTQQQLAQRAVARARQLMDAGVIGEAEFQRREGDLQQASAEVSSSRDQLIILGMSPEAVSLLETARTVNSITNVVSSIDGRVLERKVTIGQVVQAAETIFVIADLSRVWLVADVPEQSAGVLRVGKAVEAEIPALPGRPVRGTLSFVSAVVNPETRTVRARMDLANPESLFKPGMLATMTLLDGSERRRVVPNSAIIREDNQDQVLIQTGPQTFQLHAVTLGPEFSGFRVLESGIEEKQKIVLEGTFHLNNERKRRALQSE